METDVIPNASYLDLDDPFDTVSQDKSKASSRSVDGSDSGELTDDSMSDLLIEEKLKEPEERKEKGTRTSSVWSAPRREESTIRSMLDAPSEWDFGSPEERSGSSLTSRLGSVGSHSYLDNTEKMKPHELRSATNAILSAGAHLLPDGELRSAVCLVSKLLLEHKQLISSRVKLIDSMREMHLLERNLTLKLLEKLASSEETVTDEMTQKIIADMTAKLEAMGTDGSTTEADKENVSGFAMPAALSPSSPPPQQSHPYAVPPPDMARPPPPLPQLNRPPPNYVPVVPNVSVPPPSVVPLSVAEQTAFSVPPPLFQKTPSMMSMPPPRPPNMFVPPSLSQHSSMLPPGPPPMYQMPRRNDSPNYSAPPPHSFMTPPVYVHQPHRAPSMSYASPSPLHGSGDSGRRFSLGSRPMNTNYSPPHVGMVGAALTPRRSYNSVFVKQEPQIYSFVKKERSSPVFVNIKVERDT